MVTLQLSKMTLQEKLQAIDLLWGSICDESATEVSPAWHKNELEKRLAKAEAGQATFEDWEEVKKELQGLTR